MHLAPTKVSLSTFSPCTWNQRKIKHRRMHVFFVILFILESILSISDMIERTKVEMNKFQNRSRGYDKFHIKCAIINYCQWLQAIGRYRPKKLRASQGAALPFKTQNAIILVIIDVGSVCSQCFGRAGPGRWHRLTYNLIDNSKPIKNFFRPSFFDEILFLLLFLYLNLYLYLYLYLIFKDCICICICI